PWRTRPAGTSSGPRSVWSGRAPWHELGSATGVARRADVFRAAGHSIHIGHLGAQGGHGSKQGPQWTTRTISTSTRASLKHAPPPKSVSESGASALAV